MQNEFLYLLGYNVIIGNCIPVLIQDIFKIYMKIETDLQLNVDMGNCGEYNF